MHALTLAAVAVLALATAACAPTESAAQFDADIAAQTANDMQQLIDAMPNACPFNAWAHAGRTDIEDLVAECHTGQMLYAPDGYQIACNPLLPIETSLADGSFTCTVDSHRAIIARIVSQANAASHGSVP